jgi:hypothetical protein
VHSNLIKEIEVSENPTITIDESSEEKYVKSEWHNDSGNLHRIDGPAVIETTNIDEEEIVILEEW